MHTSTFSFPHSGEHIAVYIAVGVLEAWWWWWSLSLVRDVVGGSVGVCSRTSWSIPSSLVSDVVGGSVGVVHTKIGELPRRHRDGLYNKSYHTFIKSLLFWSSVVVHGRSIVCHGFKSQKHFFVVNFH